MGNNSSRSINSSSPPSSSSSSLRKTNSYASTNTSWSGVTAKEESTKQTGLSVQSPEQRRSQNHVDKFLSKKPAKVAVTALTMGMIPVEDFEDKEKDYKRKH